ncbi:antA/AntB antirepressor family protein [Haemophilus influenzae]|uniref:P22AR C-terminal domain-containing protein n=1 Tax=Haemophilus influenzae TaxID=727 RepID=UPI000DD3BD93|nr:P22AR C-terminal domain-containing protein [Haemophilus influenzae]MCK8814520.1 antA/AntB antirepressor family protein [Haemophilus influenzae]
MTNSNLISVFNGSIQNQPVQLCNARELHSFLGVGFDFSNWIKNRINEYGFIQDEDYFIITERTNGRPRKEYHITLDMGKELGMVERNERGRQIRQYFIRCERTLKALQQPQQLALPEPEKKFTREFTEHDLQQLVWAWFALLRGTELCQVLHPALKQIGSHYAASVYGVAYEYRSTLRHAHNVLTRITEQFECEQGNNWRVLKYLRAYNPKATGFQLDIL